MPEPADSSHVTHGARKFVLPADHLLRRNPGFFLLWLGQTVSLSGSQITLYGLPLVAVITLHATPAQTGLVRAAEYAPAMLVALVAGVWVDRLPRGRILVVGGIAQAILLATLPAAAVLHRLGIALLVGVVALLSVLGLVSSTASTAFLPTVVRQEELLEGNRLLAATSSVARIVGPGIAGGLVQLLTAPGAMVLDALSFLISSICIGRIHAQDVVPNRHEQRASLWSEIGAGLGMVGRNPILRAFVISSASLDIFWNALMSVYFLYVTRDLGLPPVAYGLIFGVGSVGALLAALFARRMTNRLDLGAIIVAAQLVVGLGGLLIVLAVHIPIAALPLLTAAEVLQSGAATIYGINRAGLTQAITPNHLQGRVTASIRFIGLGAVTGGALLGGVLGERLGVSPTMVIGACGGLAAFVWLLLSPIRSIKSIGAGVNNP